MLLFSDIKWPGVLNFLPAIHPCMETAYAGKETDYLIFKNKTDETANDTQSY